MRDDEAGKQSQIAEVARFLGHGFTLAASTGLFLLVGWWADGRLGSRPILTLAGALLGACLGFYSMYHQLVIAPRKERDRNPADNHRD